MRRQAIPTLLSFLMLCTIAAGPAAKKQPTIDRKADREAIVRAIKRFSDRADRAWQARDARLMFPPDTLGRPDSGAAVQMPDGRAISRAAMIADLQRRMDMTTRIDTMRTVVDSVLFWAPDSALVFSSQLFVRMMRLPGQAERQRVSSVIHRQRFGRTSRGWASAGPVEELRPMSRWADEEPKE